MTAGPFAALGLPARPDLTDDDIRAAWRRIAARTHPDRPDGGDPARFAAAAAAYTELRTRYGRGEAYADLTARNSPVPGSRRRPATARPVPSRQAAPHRETAARRETASRPETAARRETASRRQTAAGLAARARRGRPVLLALRIAIAAGLTAAAFAVTGAQPAAGGLAAGALTWLLLTGRHDQPPVPTKPT